MCGCTQPWNVRKPPGDDVKTVASVGDKPLPIRSGTPEGSIRAEDTTTELPAPSPGRISGRVYDEKGRAVPNARVRLAVGGESGGKAVYSDHGQVGAFTLRGLRPGSSYTVIAEYQGKSGMMTGRVDAQAPDANVRIGLRRRDAGLDDVRTSVRPARPNVEPISNVRESDEDDGQDEEARPAPRANREDLDPVAEEAEEVGRKGPDNSPRLSVAEEPSSKPARWGQSRRPSGPRRIRQEPAGTARPRTAGGGPAASSSSPATDGEEEGENPLPPALEPGNVGADLDRERSDERPVVLARNPSSSASRRDPSSDLLASDRGRSRRPRLAAGRRGFAPATAPGTRARGPVRQPRGLRPDLDGRSRRAGERSGKSAPAQAREGSRRVAACPGPYARREAQADLGRALVPEAAHPAGRDAPEDVARHPGRHSTAPGDRPAC